MKRFFQYCLLAACFAATAIGCGDGGKSADPKIKSGKVDPSLKPANNNNTSGDGPAGKTGSKSSTSAN
jgi:hypothetical protein